MLKIDDLHPFPDNPFRLVEDDLLMELSESIKIHLFKLVYKHKATVRIKLSNNSGGNFQMIAAGHVVPLLSSVSKASVFNRQSGERKVGAPKQVPPNLKRLQLLLMMLFCVAIEKGFCEYR